MTWAEDVRRAKEALDWIEARQGPLPEAGYARIETDVRTVRAMAEGQDDDVQISEIQELSESYSGLQYVVTDPTKQWPWGSTLAVNEIVDLVRAVPELLARLNALAAEAADVARENEALIEEVKASGEQIAALADERDARIKTLENDLEHALASVGAFRQAIETIFAKAEEHEIDQGGMIVTYVLPCGPLHRAIGLARGTDAGGKLLKRLSDTEAERDALRARAERAEAALRAVGVPLINNVMCWCQESRDMAYGHSDACRQANAALAGSREQSAGRGRDD